MCIERHRDATRLNEIVNHPSVHPCVRGRETGWLDLSMAIENPANVLLMGEHGGMLFMFLQPGLYEAHVQVLPEGRGPWTVEMVHACLHWIFCRTDAVEVVARCPDGNLAVKALARRTGWTYEFKARRALLNEAGPVDADIYAMRIQDWIGKSPLLAERGAWFRSRLAEQLLARGDAELDDEADEAQDRHLGMAYDMLCAGQPHKAVLFYNRAALLSDYLPFNVMSFEPMTIDIGGAVIIVREDDFWVATISEEAA